MTQKEKPEVADIFRALLPKIKELKLSPDKYRTFRSIIACRTAEIGTHISKCDSCEYREETFNSCWNRHCPKCQGGEAFQWTRERTEELLPTSYFHIVFTVPHEFNTLTYCNKKILYDILLKASSETLLDVAKNNLGLDIGFFGVIHTWNQELQYHPHVHYIAPGGGFTKDRTWKEFTENSKFFLPVRILSKVFRGKFIELLKEAYRSNELYLSDEISHLRNPRDFEHLVSRSASKEWVVYAKKPFAGPEVVLKYLANYTHRVGIANSRLREITDNTVSFSARDKTQKGKKRLVTLSHKAFLHRFLQHLLPKGFKRIRYFGFLSPQLKQRALKKIREQIKAEPLQVSAPAKTPNQCPCCKCGTLRVTKIYKPHGRLSRRPFPPLFSPHRRCLGPEPALNYALI